jgi:hypothetical protein
MVRVLYEVVDESSERQGGKLLSSDARANRANNPTNSKLTSILPQLPQTLHQSPPLTIITMDTAARNQFGISTFPTTASYSF